MKNYNEMAESVLNRRDEYVVERKRRTKKMTNILSCLCICVLLGVGVWHGNFTQPITNTPEYAQTSTQFNNYNLSINEIATEDFNKIFSGYSWLDPGEENFVEMTYEDVLSYFGISLDMSEINKAFKPIDNVGYGFYHFADGNVLDQQTFNFEDDTNKKINITLRKNKLPMFSIIGEYVNQMQTSQIGDSNVVVAHYKGIENDDTYYAEFMKGNIGYTVITNNCTIEEMTSVLEYLLK